MYGSKGSHTVWVFLRFSHTFVLKLVFLQLQKAQISNCDNFSVCSITLTSWKKQGGEPLSMIFKKSWWSGEGLVRPQKEYFFHWWVNSLKIRCGKKIHHSPGESLKTVQGFKRYDLSGKLEITVFAWSRWVKAESWNDLVFNSVIKRWWAIVLWARTRWHLLNLDQKIFKLCTWKQLLLGCKYLYSIPRKCLLTGWL